MGKPSGLTVKGTGVTNFCLNWDPWDPAVNDFAMGGEGGGGSDPYASDRK